MIDRGLKKWKPFIVPENKGMYDKVFKDDLKLKKPVFDESRLHSINDGLVQSIMDETEIVLTLWLDGFIETSNQVIVRKNHLITDEKWLFNIEMDNSPFGLNGL